MRLVERHLAKVDVGASGGELSGDQGGDALGRGPLRFPFSQLSPLPKSAADEPKSPNLFNTQSALDTLAEAFGGLDVLSIVRWRIPSALRALISWCGPLMLHTRGRIW
jgi:hypothetical protein